MTTISQALNDARRQLQAASPSPAVDAGILLCHVLGCNSGHLIAWPEKALTPRQTAAFADAIERRSKGEPVAYITGEREFWSLSLKVSPEVLIPRPETETLVEFVLDLFTGHDRLKIADLGTGSGAIACALASERPHWDIIATDLSTAALNIARMNASSHRLNNVRFCQGAWFEAITERDFDLVVSNPPYVAAGDEHLAQGDVRYEPEAALVSGDRGLDAITVLTAQAGAYLRRGGWLIVALLLFFSG